jgi:hypothetical protein
MPTWQPDWTDVTFDFAGAHAAINECRLVRQVLQDRDVVLSVPLAVAREQWRGPKRVAFDDYEDALRRKVFELIDHLWAVEERLNADIARANDDQVRRILQRARWHEEHQAELRLQQLRQMELARQGQ